MARKSYVRNEDRKGGNNCYVCNKSVWNDEGFFCKKDGKYVDEYAERRTKPSGCKEK